MSTSNSDLRTLSLSQALRSVAGEAAFLVAALVVVLGVVEITLRVFDDFGANGPNQIRLRGEDPETRIQIGRPWYQREFQVPIHLNRAGYHATEFDAQPDRPVRIAILGDSFIDAQQLPVNQHLGTVAQDQLPGVQFLSLGGSAQYLPRQLSLFRDRLPELFGPHGEYPPVDGVVFCLRIWGMRHIARGDVKYEVSSFPQPARYRLKKKISPRVGSFVTRGIQSPFHSVSYLSAKAKEWLDGDLAGALPPMSDQQIAFADRVIREEVLQEILDLAESRGLEVGFFYLPSAEEYRGVEPPQDAEFTERILQALRDTGKPVIHALDFFPRDQVLYFPSDRHMNAKGHAAAATGMVALVERMGLVPN